MYPLSVLSVTPQVWTTAVLSAYQHGQQSHLHLSWNTRKEWRETSDHRETKEKPSSWEKGTVCSGLKVCVPMLRFVTNLNLVMPGHENVVSSPDLIHHVPAII